MKSLYSILGLHPDASTTDIETAYAAALIDLQKPATGTNPDEQRIRLVALKEAHTVLSDPAKRKQYNEKLFAPGKVARQVPSADFEDIGAITVVEHGGHRKLYALTALLLGGLGLYLYNAHETEAMRLQHEAQMKAADIAAQNQALQAEQVADREQRQRDVDARMEYARQQQQINMQHAQDAQADAMRAQQERAEAIAQENAQRKQAQDAQQRLARDKALLRSLEIEHYGKVITTN